jgi:hypothetical protein
VRTVGTLRALLEEALRRALDQWLRRRKSPFRLRDASVDGCGVRPELRDASWDRLNELAHGASDDDAP